MTRKSFVLMLAGTMILLLCSVSSAVVPDKINYQGKLATAQGGCLNDTVSMTFSIYSDDQGTVQDWTEDQDGVIVKEGIFDVLLGSDTPIPASVFDGSTKYLGVKVESDDEMRPLKPIVSVAYAYRAGTADGGGWVDDGSIVRLETDSDSVGIGTTDPAAKLDVSGDININSVYKIGGEAVLSAPEAGNVFVGVGAGGNNTGGSVTLVGHNAGYNNQGSANIFLGVYAGFNTTGMSNIFLGNFAGYSNTTGQVNTFVGGNAGRSNTTGQFNTFLGFDAGRCNTTGYGNTFLGRSAGYYDTTGCGNVFIGSGAGGYETGSYKLYIANGGDTSDVLIYGDFSTDRVGINTLTPTEELHVVGDIYCTGKLTSDGGNDPPYVLYNNETRKTIVKRVAKEVPSEKLDGAVLFWNGDDSRFEVYLPAKGEFRDMQGTLLATVNDLKGAR